MSLEKEAMREMVSLMTRVSDGDKLALMELSLFGAMQHYKNLIEENELLRKEMGEMRSRMTCGKETP